MYFIIHGDGNGNFTIINNTGKIMTGGILNREVLDQYVLTIEARDGEVFIVFTVSTVVTCRPFLYMWLD